MTLAAYIIAKVFKKVYIAALVAQPVSLKFIVGLFRREIKSFAGFLIIFADVGSYLVQFFHNPLPPIANPLAGDAADLKERRFLV